MLDTIILLTGPVEQPVLAEVLKRQSPRLTVRFIETLPQLEALDQAVLARARLVAFVTPVIVPGRILNLLGYGAYNFHPAPPHYPGWVPSYLAVYDRATQYGATAHAMIERVDAGPIIDTEVFDVPPGAGVADLEAMAFRALAQIFWRQAKALATLEQPLPPCGVEWSGRKSTRRLYETLCDIPSDIAREELDRRLTAFADGHFGMFPTVTLHGRRFRLTPEPTAANQPEAEPMRLAG